MDTNTHNKKTCRICNNDEHNRQVIAREMMFGFRDEFSYFECNNCNCLQIVAFPDDMSKYYPENYYSFSEYKPNIFNGFSGLLKKKKYFFLITGGRVLRRIMSLFSGTNNYFIFQGLNISKNTRILDIGCGNGSNFLYPLAEIGFKNLRGCDPYLKTSISYGNGLHIDNTHIYEAKGAWDVITYHHSFEHIPNPVEHMKKVYKLLKPGGVCVIRIPTTSSFAWEHYGINWVQLDAPRHFFLHSRESMQIIGEHSKLELYKTVYDSTHFQFLGSEKYINNESLLTPDPKGFINKIRRKIKKHNYQKKAKSLNKKKKGDQAAFFFRKSSSQTSANKT